MQVASATFEFSIVTRRKRQIDPADIADEERVVRENEPVVYQKADVLGCVTRPMDLPNVAVADIEEISVGKGFEVDPHGGVGSHAQASIRQLGELTCSR